jgi:hypothetical protein
MPRTIHTAAAAIIFSLAASSASAQTFSFGIGVGGHGQHHHHHHGGWHFDYHDCWHRPYYYAPRYVYVEPAPVIRERVTYVERAPAVVRNEPTLAGTQIANTLITVQNASNRNVAVTFLMDAQDVALRDGEVRSFTGRSSRVVEFDRGGEFGAARYDLNAGDYEFVITDNGWDLRRRSAAPAASTAARPTVRKNALPSGPTLR